VRDRGLIQGTLELGSPRGIMRVRECDPSFSGLPITNLNPSSLFITRGDYRNIMQVQNFFGGYYDEWK